MNKTHEIIFNNAYGKEVKFELYTSVTVPAKIEYFPITNYRLSGKLSEYGLGYHNQRLLLEIADDKQFLELFNNNLEGDVAVRVLLDGVEMFWGSPEYELYSRARREGKEILQIEFQSGLNMSGVNILSLQDDDTSSAGWIRLARFYSNLFSYSRRDLTQANVDVEYSVFHRALEYYYDSPFLGENGYSFSADESHGVLWMPLNLIWGRKIFVREDVEAFAMDVARMFNARFGWSWLRNSYVFNTLVPPVFLVTSTHHMIATTENGKLVKFDTATKTVLGENTLLTPSSQPAYKMAVDYDSNNIYVTAGERFIITDFDLVNVNANFIVKAGLEARSVYFEQSSKNAFVGFDNDTAGQNAQIISKNANGTVNFDLAIPSVNTPFDITTTNTKIAILTNAGSIPNRVVRISKSDGAGSTILVDAAGCIFSDNNTLYVGMRDGTIQARIDSAASVSEVIDTGITESANSDAVVRSIRKHKEGFIVAVGKYIVKFNPDWEIIQTSTQGTANILLALDTDPDTSKMNFALREAGAGTSMIAVSDVNKADVGFSLYSYNASPDAWTDFICDYFPSFNERVKIPVCKATESNEITSGSTTINDMTLEEIDFQTIDESKWEAWPIDRLNTPVRSANGVVNNRVSPSYEDYEYELDFIGGTNGTEPEQLKHVAQSGAVRPMDRLHNLDWRMAKYENFSGSPLEESLGRDYIRTRNTLSQRTRGYYNGIIDPMIPIKLDNGDLLYIIDYEVNLEYEITNIKETHIVRSEIING